VIEPWPKVAALPANQVTGEQVADMMRRVIELGKARTSNKLRSYVRAAYQTAKAARSKASIPVRFKGYNVTHNPGADTEPDESANRADKRPLTAEELRSYWQAIKTLPGQRGAVLRWHLDALAKRQQPRLRARLQTKAAPQARCKHLRKADCKGWFAAPADAVFEQVAYRLPTSNRKEKTMLPFR